MPTAMFTTVADGGGRRRALVALAVAGALALCACSGPSKGEPSVDANIVQAAIEQIAGVTDAEVGVISAGSPGSYILDTQLTVDEDGDARLAAVLRETAAVLARDAADVGRYTVSVIAPVPGEPGGTDVVTMSAREAELGLPGHYSDTDIEWTTDQVRAAAGTAG